MQENKRLIFIYVGLIAIIAAYFIFTRAEINFIPQGLVKQQNPLNEIDDRETEIKNNLEAVEWYKKAAEEGDASAMAQLAYIPTTDEEYRFYNV